MRIFLTRLNEDTRAKELREFKLLMRQQQCAFDASLRAIYTKWWRMVGVFGVTVTIALTIFLY